MRKVDFNSIVLQTDSTSSFINPPIIPTFRDIANLIECMAMFYFIKGLSVFRIVTENKIVREKYLSNSFVLRRKDFQLNKDE